MHMSRKYMTCSRVGTVDRRDQQKRTICDACGRNKGIEANFADFIVFTSRSDA